MSTQYDEMFSRLILLDKYGPATYIVHYWVVAILLPNTVNRIVNEKGGENREAQT